MARRNVFICDEKDCGAVLVHPDDGFVFYGVVRNTDIENASKTLIMLPDAATGAATDPPETVLCKDCLIKRLGLDEAKPK